MVQFSVFISYLTTSSVTTTPGMWLINVSFQILSDPGKVHQRDNGRIGVGLITYIKLHKTGSKVTVETEAQAKYIHSHPKCS